MLTAESLAELRVALETERDQLVRQIDDIDEDAESIDDNFADSGQVAAEMGENLTLVSALREQLADVEHALAKFDDGTFGQCEADGAPIPVDRLEAMPATRFCIEHA
ncbi:MAG: hypothetical protein GXY13_06740 [Acidimicrobiales bacterium]|nr:hypothetical protein [Acidimicrobiales bacterium]